MDYLALKGKKALIAGVANERSIAWGIAQCMHEAGMQLAFTYQEKLGKWVLPLVESLAGSISVTCDASSDEDLKRATAEIGQKLGKIDCVVHAIAFAPPDDLKGKFIDISRQGFQIAQDVSAYSLVALCKHTAPHMNDGGSVMALTYYGSNRVIGNYHIMGTAKASLEACVRYLAADMGERKIRVNAISAGPIKTLSARGVPGFNAILEQIEQRSPLHCNVTPEDVADTALFLASQRSKTITGHVIYVDSGYNIMGI